MSAGLSAGAITALMYFGVPCLVFVGWAFIKGLESVGDKMNYEAIRRKVQRLIDRPAASFNGLWNLPAPESSALFNEPYNPGDQPFRLGIMQLLAERVLIMEVTLAENETEQSDAAITETVLLQGPVSADRLQGSLAAIYHLWESLPDPRTITNLALEANRRYGSLRDFTQNVVNPQLAEARLYSRKDYHYRTDSGWASSYGSGGDTAGYREGQYQVVTSYTLTQEGKEKQADLEGRVGSILQRLNQEKPEWIKNRPEQALMAALVAVATGQNKSAEETEMALVTQQTGAPLSLTAAQTEDMVTSGYDSGWIDWNILDNLERACSAIETSWNRVEEIREEADGDHGDGGEGGDSSDSGDYGDSGGGGD